MIPALLKPLDNKTALKVSVPSIICENVYVQVLHAAALSNSCTCFQEYFIAKSLYYCYHVTTTVIVQELFIEVGCFEKIVEVLRLVKDQAKEVGIQ